MPVGRADKSPDAALETSTAPACDADLVASYMGRCAHREASQRGIHRAARGLRGASIEAGTRHMRVRSFGARFEDVSAGLLIVDG
jgi:hypothetical protein